MARIKPTDSFGDINKFPADWGLLLFPISMARIANAQTADQCIEYLRWFAKTKISSPTIGVQIIYTESLYLNYYLAENGASEAREKRLNYLQQTENHKQRMMKIIKKLSTSEFQIPQAFQFNSWDQMLCDTTSFSSRLKKLKKIYQADKKFQTCVKEDCKIGGKQYTPSQIDFFLEECLCCYLSSMGQSYFNNEHVLNRQRWILWCYPGKPPKALLYLYQLNPFDLATTKNKYEQAMYDLTDKKLYDAKFISFNY